MMIRNYWEICRLAVLAAFLTVGCGQLRPPATNSVEGMSISKPVEPIVHEFTLPAGWGARSWNTSETTFRMRVGATWRIKNLDASVPHTLHTPDSPCPHGGTKVFDAGGNKIYEGRNFNEIPVGGWLDCVLTSPVATSRNIIYDHFQYDGPNGQIHLVVTE